MISVDMGVAFVDSGRPHKCGEGLIGAYVCHHRQLVLSTRCACVCTSAYVCVRGTALQHVLVMRREALQRWDHWEPISSFAVCHWLLISICIPMCELINSLTVWDYFIFVLVV